MTAIARHELVEALANADELPIQAIGGCLIFIDEVAPDLLAVVESAAAGTLDRPADDRLLFIASPNATRSGCRPSS